MTWVLSWERIEGEGGGNNVEGFDQPIAVAFEGVGCREARAEGLELIVDAGWMWWLSGGCYLRSVDGGSVADKHSQSTRVPKQSNANNLKSVSLWESS